LYEYILHQWVVFWQNEPKRDLLELIYQQRILPKEIFALVRTQGANPLKASNPCPQGRTSRRPAAADIFVLIGKVLTPGHEIRQNSTVLR
jgi:hypothetical protein